ARPRSRLQHARLELARVVPSLVRGLQGRDELLARPVGLDDAVHPAPGRAVADVLLLAVAGVHRGENLLVRLLVDGLALALAALLLDHGECTGRLVGAHDRALGARPGEGDELVEGAAAHRVVSGPV